MICFYHSADLDGHCAGALVKHAHPKCKMIGIDYGEPFPWKMVTGSVAMKNDLWMVDFCLQPFEEMEKLHTYYGKNLIWVDHHKTAIEEAALRDFNPPGRRQIGKAACELVWDFLYGPAPAPSTVLHLGRYDVWDHSHGHTLPLQYGMRMEDTWPDNQELWKPLIEKNPHMFRRIRRAGNLILRYQESRNKKIVKVRGFEAACLGMWVVACNAPLANSKLFDSVWDPAKYSAMVVYSELPAGGWTVSMYTDREDVDVGALCKLQGGGGHKNAAGFQCKTLDELFTQRKPLED